MADAYKDSIHQDTNLPLLSTMSNNNIFNTKSFQSLTEAKYINSRYASFQDKQAALKEKQDALEAEKKKLEAEKAKEEMRFWEDVFNKSLESMLRLARGNTDKAQRERLLHGIEKKIHEAEEEVEKMLPPKIPASKVILPPKVVKYVDLSTPSPIKPVKRTPQASPSTTSPSVPQKRTSTRAGFREYLARVETDDDTN